MVAESGLDIDDIVADHTTGLACEVLTGDYLECELAAFVENSGGTSVIPDLSAYFEPGAAGVLRDEEGQ